MITTKPGHSSLRSIQERKEVKATTINRGRQQMEIGQIAEIDSKDHHTEMNLRTKKIQMRHFQRRKMEEILGKTADLAGVEVGQEIGSF